MFCIVILALCNMTVHYNLNNPDGDYTAQNYVGKYETTEVCVHNESDLIVHSTYKVSVHRI